MCNTGNEMVISQLQNTKSNFPKLCKVYARKNKKKKSDTFTYKFSRKYCRFQEAFLAKIIYTKNTLHALNPLISPGNKRSHIV